MSPWTSDVEPADRLNPSPYALWVQANGDRAEYRRLMVEYGYLIPGKQENLPCGWPHRPEAEQP